MQSEAASRGSPRHQTVHAGAVAGDRRAGRSGGGGAARRGRAAHHGRRAHLRFHRRHGIGPSGTRSRLGEAHKRRLAGNLLQAAPERFAPGGVLHFGQGKWYPGGAATRWGSPASGGPTASRCGRNLDLLADDTKDHGATTDHAERFSRALVRRLGLPEDRIVPGYEDPLYLLYAEGNLPDNVDPLRADLKDSMERKRIARLLSGDPNRPVGYALPIEWAGHATTAPETWASSPWTFRRGSMFLIPGDSPMGLRLPLDALPWTAEERLPMPERSLMAPVPPLADFHAIVSGRIEPETAREAAEPRKQPAPRERRAPARPGTIRTAKVVHTALCAEARNGRLHVFLPPLGHLEPYLELVAAVEGAAGEMVTPDPGVIEVNIHPSASWVRTGGKHHETLYEEARLARPRHGKFMLDGRHTGTGGGNHVTLGGTTPADSPFLRRPDLLRSLITYWQHHPGLSYLFSGHVHRPHQPGPAGGRGPRRQAARTRDRLQPAAHRRQQPPWLVDRVLRNLLTDLTGNTHRAEFCIDKLYSPDQPSRTPRHRRVPRLRNAAPRPHEPAATAAGPALAACSGKNPTTKNWCLGHRTARPLPAARICRRRTPERGGGSPGRRVPILRTGSPLPRVPLPPLRHHPDRACALELRIAIEPWHVLGEEQPPPGRPGIVDSSAERLQLQGAGLTDRAPRRDLQRTPRSPRSHRNPRGFRGRHPLPGLAALVRLHPTLAPQTPLVFDVVDLWNGRSLGAAPTTSPTPAAGATTTLPVNALEAEARRVSRFWPRAAPERNPEYPHTLDLRRAPDVPA
jgi:uncharacterized protein (DUF2126 family)